MTGEPLSSPKKLPAWLWTLPVLLFLAIWLRVISLPRTNPDVESFLVPWYQYIVRNGGFKALADSFSNYNVPYLYLLWGATLFKSIPQVTAIKLISILGDLVGALLVYLILRRKYARGALPWLGFLLYLAAPVVWINSAYWGQSDGIYTAALLASLLALIDDRPYLGAFWFGVAFAFKIQAVFFAPLLLVLLLRRKIPWAALGLIPLAYVALDIPAFLAGRSWQSLFSIYLDQAEQYHELTKNAPNIYAFFSNDLYSTLLWVGLVVAGSILLLFVVLAARSKAPITPQWLLTGAAFFLFLVPFLLPKMHERYFYPVAAILIPLLLVDFRQVYAAILLQISGLLSYTIFLLFYPSDLLQIASLLNFVALALLTRSYLRELSPAGNTKSALESMHSSKI
jgi:Gpi18-like mannosyltransferase